MANKYPRMGDLDFGRIDALDEARYSPALLLEGYFDHANAAYRIGTGDGWTVIGPKGAGKSAVIEHLDLKWNLWTDRFLVRWELNSFPVGDVTQLQMGSMPGPSATRAAWELLILLKVFESLHSDQGLSCPGDVSKLYDALARSGMVRRAEDLRTRLSEWSRAVFRLHIPPIDIQGERGGSDVDPLQLLEILKGALRLMSTGSRHVLVMDGLDGFFATNDSEFESLGALLDAGYEINNLLAGTATNSSVVMCVRTDMFQRAPSTDSAKLMGHSIELDWTKRGEANADELWGLVSKKARTSVPSSFSGNPIGDIRKAYLKTPIRIRRYDKIPSYLISLTRMLPRDLIALLNEIKNVSPHERQVTEQEIRTAVRRYADRYFVREISNNVSLVVPGVSPSQTSDFFDALSALPRRTFDRGTLQEHLADAIAAPQLRKLLSQLYTVGGLGVRVESPSGAFTNFSYRRSAGGGFNFNSKFVLHNALVEAWNIPWQ